MEESDRQRLTAAFRESVGRLEDPDRILMTGADGQKVTARQLAEHFIETGGLYRLVEKGRQGVEWWICRFNNGPAFPGLTEPPKP